MSQVNILTGNMFACNNNPKGVLPKQDPSYTSYSCGSSSINSSLSTAAALVGIGCLFILRTFWISKQNSLRFNIKSKGYVSWITKIASVDKLQLAYKSTESPKGAGLNEKIANFSLFYKSLVYIRRICFGVLALALFVLIPSFSGISGSFSTYKEKYIWTVSAIYLSGNSAAAAVYCILMVFQLGFILVGTKTVAVRSVAVVLPTSVVDAPTSLLSVQIRESTGNGNVDTNAIKPWKEKIVYYAPLTIIAVVNCTVVIVANVGYVLGLKYLASDKGVSPSVVTVFSISFSIFKTLWNSKGVAGMLALRKIQKKSKSSGDHDQHGEGEGGEKETDNNNNDDEETDKQGKHDDVVLKAIMSTFNLVVSPVIAVFFANTDCFLYAISSPPQLIRTLNIPFAANLPPLVTVACKKYGIQSSTYFTLLSFTAGAVRLMYLQISQRSWSQAC